MIICCNSKMVQGKGIKLGFRDINENYDTWYTRRGIVHVCPVCNKEVVLIKGMAEYHIDEPEVDLVIEEGQNGQG